MACQPAVLSPHVQAWTSRESQTKRRIELTRRRISRIEHAKALVCGVVAPTPLEKLRRDFEGLLAALEDGFKVLTSGLLDNSSDDQLRALLASLQKCDTGISEIIGGAARIGLEGSNPFPELLEQLRIKQGRLQSNIEGIILSLDSSFQDLVSQSVSRLAAKAK
jgi:hypothetical protein